MSSRCRWPSNQQQRQACATHVMRKVCCQSEEPNGVACCAARAQRSTPCLVTHGSDSCGLLCTSKHTSQLSHLCTNTFRCRCHTRELGPRTELHSGLQTAENHGTSAGIRQIPTHTRMQQTTTYIHPLLQSSSGLHQTRATTESDVCHHGSCSLFAGAQDLHRQREVPAKANAIEHSVPRNLRCNGDSNQHHVSTSKTCSG
jgi:hypothetical protein